MVIVNDMTNQAARHLQYETEFLSTVDSNLQAARGSLLVGTVWKTTRQDEADRLRATMAKSGIFDREMLKALPANRRVSLHGYEKSWLFWKKPTGVAIASTLSPLSHYVDPKGGDAPPIGLGELADHVRKLVTQPDVPHLIGVCSPSGFAPEAYDSKLDLPHVTLILIEPDSTGGWKVTPTADSVDHRILELFDPEDQSEKIDRARQMIEECSADLLGGGLTASVLARKANLPEHLVRRAFDQVAAADPELHANRSDGECYLYRGAPASTLEKKPMNVVDRIKQLFAKEGDEATKINMLSERRAALARRRERIYEDISKLEKREAQLLEEGKAAKSQVPRRRIAAQLGQLRKDIGRQNTTAAMLNQQINIISTDIHNLTLIQQGEMAQLPDTEELTENAVKAEELLETLAADSEMVEGLETGMQDAVTSEEELAILREFEATPAVSEPPSQIARAESAPAPEAEPPSTEQAAPQSKTREGADPEAG